MFWFVFIAAAAAECRLADLQLSLDAGEAAYTTGDEATFRQSAAAALVTVNCLTEPATPAVAARTHRLAGFVAFADREKMDAESYFSAARIADPSLGLPASLAAPQGPLAKTWNGAKTTNDPTVALVAPASGMLMFDGRVALSRPAERPTLAQWVNIEGTSLATAMLQPDDSMISYAVAAPAAASVSAAPANAVPTDGATATPTAPAKAVPPSHAPANLPASTSVESPPVAQTVPLPPITKAAPARPRTSVSLAIASGASLLVAGGLYAASYATYQEYDAANPDTEMRDLNHALVIADGATLALGVGLGAAAFISGTW